MKTRTLTTLLQLEAEAVGIRHKVHGPIVLSRGGDRLRVVGADVRDALLRGRGGPREALGAGGMRRERGRGRRRY